MAKHKLIYLLLDTTQDPSLDSESWTSGTLNKKEASKARLVLGMVGVSPSLQCMISKYRHSWGFLGIPSPTTNSATEHGPPAHCPTFTEQSYWPGSICVGLSWDDTFFLFCPQTSRIKEAPLCSVSQPDWAEPRNHCLLPHPQKMELKVLETLRPINTVKCCANYPL